MRGDDGSVSMTGRRNLVKRRSHLYLPTANEKGFLNGPFCSFFIFKQYLRNKNCMLQRDSNSHRQSTKASRLPVNHHHDPEKGF